MPRALIACTHSTQRTGPNACWYSAARMRSGSTSTLTSMLLITGICGAAKRRCRQPFLQPFGGRLHQAGVERRRHRQRQGTLGAAGLEHFAGLFDRFPAAGDHGLRRIVEIHRLHDFGRVRAEAAHRLGTALDHLLRVHAQDGGHRTGAHRHRVLHRLGAKPHQGAASASVSTPEATSAEYSPSEWPATTAGAAPPSARQARQAATPATSMTGWVLVVRPSASLGPSLMSRARSSPSASEASCRRRPRPDDRPRRPACRQPASPGRERRMRTVSCHFQERKRSAAARRSEVEQHGAPGEAAAHAFEHQRVALRDLAAAHRRVQRQRNRCGRGVAMLVHRDDDLVHAAASAFSRCSA